MSEWTEKRIHARIANVEALAAAEGGWTDVTTNEYKMLREILRLREEIEKLRIIDRDVLMMARRDGMDEAAKILEAYLDEEGLLELGRILKMPKGDVAWALGRIAPVYAAKIREAAKGEPK